MQSFGAHDFQILTARQNEAPAVQTACCHMNLKKQKKKAD